MKSLVSLVCGLVLCMAGVVGGSSPAAAASGSTTTSAGPVSTQLASTQSATLSDALIAKATPFIVTAANGSVSLSAKASTSLTAAELAEVRASITSFNASPTKAGDYAGAGASGAVPMSGKIHAPRCAWRISWSHHWYGWTVKLNGCLVGWIVAATSAAAGLSNLTAFVQGYLDIPNDVAAFVAALAWAGSGAMGLQWLTCYQLGYSGVAYYNRFGATVPGCY